MKKEIYRRIAIKTDSSDDISKCDMIAWQTNGEKIGIAINTEFTCNRNELTLRLKLFTEFFNLAYKEFK